jgi:glutamine amidotransferase
VQIFKEPKCALDSELTDFLKRYKDFRTPLLVAHVRSASQGGIIHASTHPFDRELNGRKWVLIHNGDVAINKLNTGRFKPLGMCDSEHLLCHILNRIESKKISQWDKSDFEWLGGMLKETNDAGYMNCNFSDGRHLFVYRDKGPHKCWLHYIVL